MSDGDFAWVPVAGTVVGLLLLALLISILVTFNRFVRLRNSVDRAWSNIDVLLQQRNDEVPNLVATVKGYAAHEKATFDTVTLARGRVAVSSSMSGKAAASDALSAGVVRLLAVAEAYPRLRADANFLALQKRLSTLEDAIADRREFYNESVRIFNTRLDLFPDSIVARRMKAKPRGFFRAEEGAKSMPSTSF